MRKSSACLVLALLAAPTLAAADPPCDRSRSFFDCWSALTSTAQAATATRRQALASAVSAAGQALVVEAAQERSGTAASPGTAGALTNLLPVFFGALGIDGLSETDGNLNFDRVWEVGEGLRVDLGATVFLEAEPFEALVAALPEAIRGEESERLDGEIGDFDKTDLTLLATWEKRTGDHRFGRDPDDYAKVTKGWFHERHDAAVAAAAKAAGGTPFGAWVHSELVDEALAEFERKKREREQRGEVIDSRKDEFESAPIEMLAEDGWLGEESVAALERSMVAAAAGEAAFLGRIRAPMVELADRVSDLITNQPQLLVEGIYRERDHFTGPSEWSARLCFEMGLSGNFNDFVNWAKEHPEDEDGNDLCRRLDPHQPIYSLACFEAYLSSDSAIGLAEGNAKDRGHRLTAAAQYTDTDPLRLELPDHDFVFDLDRSQKWTASLAYGVYFKRFQLPNLVGDLESVAGAEDTARFDLEAAYDDVTGDPTRQSRFTATATISQKTSDNTVLSLSAVWANKPEYLGEVDEELSARFGLKWQRDEQKNGQGSGQ